MLNSNGEGLRSDDRSTGALLLWSGADDVAPVIADRLCADPADHAFFGENCDLHVRLQAIEHLMIAVLADGSQRALDRAHATADRLSPDPSVARYSMTRRIGDQMATLVAQAERIREGGGR